jgi:CRISPR-associated protein Csm4
MQTYRLTLRPLTAFGTKIAGDTLFGMLCRILRRRRGESFLNELLEGYTQDRPFAVLSDAVPGGFLPLPTLPAFFWTTAAGEDRKKSKSRRWLALEHRTHDLALWQSNACDDEEAYAAGISPDDRKAYEEDIARIPGAVVRYAPQSRAQQHNTVNRLTGTTGQAPFAPYGMDLWWYHPKSVLDVYAVLDESRLKGDEFLDALTAMGELGYGRDAGIGAGKFEIVEKELKEPAWTCDAAKSFMTLAPCAPQGLGYDAERSFYQVRTHFGRHGEEDALSGNPFKKPLLTAKTGAVFTLSEAVPRLFLGQGITGISAVDARTVHQGYAPVVPLPALPEPEISRTTASVS